MLRRKWTAKDRAYLRLHYGPNAPEPLPTREIARVLGWTTGQVYPAARWFGLLHSRRPPVGLTRSRVRELYEAGKTPTEMAAELGVAYETARRHVLALGFVPHRRRWGTYEERRRHFLDSLQNAGYRSPGDVARICHGVAAARAGWPCCTSAGQARVLGAVYDGAETVAAVRVGMSQSAVCFHLLRLFEAGLVVRRKDGFGYRYRCAPGVCPGSKGGGGRPADMPRGVA